jgi:ribosomal protein L27
VNKLILILPFFLSGCFYQSVDSNDIETGKIICRSKGADLVSINSFSIGRETVFCSNRVTYRISEYNLPE